MFYLLWHHHSPATEKKVKASWTSFSVEWNQNMWFCATTDTGHAQISYLTVARHILQSRLIMLQLPIHGEYIGNYCHFCLIIAVCNFTVKPFLRRNNIGLDVKALFASHPLSSKSGDKTNHVIQQNNFEKRLFRCTRLFMDWKLQSDYILTLNLVEIFWMYMCYLSWCCIWKCVLTIEKGW